MTKKKKSDKDARPDKDKPESGEDLEDIMAIDEDLELLQMTERTLVGPSSEDEETISLSDAIAAEEEEESAYDFSEAPDAEDEPADDAMDLSESEEEEDDDDDDADETQTDDLTPATNAKKIVPDLSASEDDDEADETEIEEDAPDSETDEGGKGTVKKSYKIIVLLGVLILAALIIIIVLLIQKKPAEPQDATSEKANRSIEVPVSEPEPVSKAKPVQAVKPVTRPQQPQPQPQRRPAAEQARQSIPATQQQAAPKTVEENQQAVPVTPTSPQRQIPQQQTATPPPVVREDRTTLPPTVQTLYDISFRETGGTLQMKIRTNGPPGEYKSFPLSNPDRLVIDLFGKWDKPPFWEKKVTTSRITRIRLGPHEDKLRIVLDLNSKIASDPGFTTASDGLIMSIPNR